MKRKHADTNSVRKSKTARQQDKKRKTTTGRKPRKEKIKMSTGTETTRTAQELYWELYNAMERQQQVVAGVIEDIELTLCGQVEDMENGVMPTDYDSMEGTVGIAALGKQYQVEVKLLNTLLSLVNQLDEYKTVCRHPEQ